jgi:hypothetical protein
MKKLSFIILFLLFLIGKESLAQCKVDVWEISFYSGYINNKYPIKMAITVMNVYTDSDQMYCVYRGYYYYTNVGKKLFLYGGYNPNGYMGAANPREVWDDIVERENEDGNTITGIFSFIRADIGGNEMNGYWQKSIDSNEKYPVKLKKIF